MNRRILGRALCLALAMPTTAAYAVEPAPAGTDADPADARPALRADAWVSSDTDGMHTSKLALGWDVAHRDLEHWWGAKVETVRHAGDGWSDRDQRAYLAGAGSLGDWRWEGEVGGNGDALLGRGALHSTDPWRKEVFIERDVLETRGGTANGWVQTFAGAAIDMPFADRWSATALAGVQAFGVGSNRRVHLRANLQHVLMPEQGIGLQLRSRYQHDSHPGEADYYAPGWRGEVLGAVSVRRFIGGWRWSALAGVGRQRAAGDGWRSARLLQLGMESPRWRDAWLRVDAGYSDTPGLASSGDDGYGYRFLRVQGVVVF